MKKLMIAAAAVALAVSAQAALTAQIKTEAPGAPKITSTESVSGYACFILSGTKVATAMDITSIGATEVDKVAAWLSKDFETNCAKLDKQAPAAMEKMYTQSALDFRNSNGSLSYANRFGIVTWKNTEGDITAFRVFNFNGSNNINDWAGTSTTGKWTDWQAVPEPTSGLLLLLGVAGLALRRKQK